MPGVARADQVLTGVLRCKAEDIPISVKANETLRLDQLKACDYQLVMNVADGFVPLNTPRIVSFKQDAGEEQVVEVKYRPPVDVAKLNGLPLNQDRIVCPGPDSASADGHGQERALCRLQRNSVVCL